MVNAMQKSEGNLLKLDDIKSLQKEIEILKEENGLLKNQVANQVAKDTSFSRASESERRHIILYLEEISTRIHGIPAISNIIKNVLQKIARGVSNGDHLKQETYDRR